MLLSHYSDTKNLGFLNFFYTSTLTEGTGKKQNVLEKWFYILYFDLFPFLSERSFSEASLIFYIEDYVHVLLSICLIADLS